MQMSKVAAELRRPLRLTPQIPIERSWGRRLTQKLIGLMPDTAVDGVEMEIRDSEPRLRIYRPVEARSSAALFWIHGGGMVIGAAAQDDHLCASTARELGIVVVSAEYRLAPEHPFPAPFDDCYAGWVWLQEQAEALGVDPNRIAIGGQSAGGGLAASLVQRLHDEGGVEPVAQWLLSPMLDDRTAARRDLDAVRHRVWSNAKNAFGWRAFLDAEPGSDEVPPYAVAARRADLTGLPPAWIGVGDIDLFLDEDCEYARRLQESGVSATLHVVPGAPHGFEAWAPKALISQAYVAEAQSWLASALQHRGAHPLQ